MSTPQDDKPDNLSKKEPSRDDQAEQEARSEEYKQEAEKLLELHREDKILGPGMFLGIVSVYLLFVTAVIAFGALASSSGHITTLRITFIASIAMLLIVPIGAIWYLRAFFRKQPAEKVASDKQSLLAIIMQTPVSRLLGRIGNSRIVRLLNPVFCIFMIADAIRIFPNSPRFSLGIIATYIILFLMLVVLEFSRAVDSALRKEIKEIWEFNVVLRNAVTALGDIAITTSTNLNGLAEAHTKLAEAYIKTTDHTLDSLAEMNRFARELANIPEPSQPDAPAVEEDKEPNDH